MYDEDTNSSIAEVDLGRGHQPEVGQPPKKRMKQSSFRIRFSYVATSSYQSNM